jgi:hypothetical protein
MYVINSGADVIQRFLSFAIFSCFLTVSIFATKTVASEPCERLCKAKHIVSLTPISYGITNQEVLLEAWANELISKGSSAAYLTYMDGYQALSTPLLNTYSTRYARRQLRGPELVALYKHFQTKGKAALSKDIGLAFSESKERVNQYTDKLIWGGMREERRYLIRRLADVSGSARLPFVLDAQTRHFIGQYMVQFAERWSVPKTQRNNSDALAMTAVTHWLSEEMDKKRALLERHHQIEIVDRLTYQLRHFSDEQLRGAIAFYEHPLYQKMLSLIEKSVDLHVQRQYSKSNLSDPAL